MLPKVNPTKTKQWKRLEKLKKLIQKQHLNDLFRSDPHRFEAFNYKFEDAVFDFSKHYLNDAIKNELIDLALKCGFSEGKEALFSGQKVNETENRAVLHHALRNVGDLPIEIDGKDVMPEVNEALSKMKVFSEKVISGSWLGFTGKPITDVVNIGIGGSDLGPQMVCEALKNYQTRLNVHFVSNVDPAHLTLTLQKLSPETTLFLVASKTFTTQETMANAELAKKWLLQHSKKRTSVKQHFVALSTNTAKVLEFGIDKQNIFRFNDWVGGRFSLWSSIGLSICLAIGYENFEELLVGAFTMDLHFKYATPDRNIPLMMALLDVWYVNFWDFKVHAVLPYSQHLHRFPAYLQQAEMESNGKSIDRKGKVVNYATSPVIFGEAGTNGQHAFYQLMHQGTQKIPADFIGFVNSKFDYEMNKLLVSNMLAQSQALMCGKNKEQVKNELSDSGLNPEQIKALFPHKVFEGNRPSTTILFKELTPRSLGSLIAAYEHKIFTQGLIWNVFSYDQWGVELGKVLAKEIYSDLKAKSKTKRHDSSTNGLIEFIKVSEK